MSGVSVRRVEVWSLRIGLVLVFLGTSENHHTTESGIGVAFLAVSVFLGVVPYARRRYRQAKRGDEAEYEAAD